MTVGMSQTRRCSREPSGVNLRRGPTREDEFPVAGKSPPRGRIPLEVMKD